MLYPLRFKEIFRNYKFGNRWIAASYPHKDLPSSDTIAETWEICDRQNESSLLINGPLAGRTLNELIQIDPDLLLGPFITKRYGKEFPLLIKLLDASFTLGEQVHHSDRLAEKYGLKDPGKTEAWYMLQTKTSAVIHCGQRSNEVTKQVAENALRNDSIRNEMQSYNVQPGDSFLLYAGTMHYSPGGVLFYEIMQNSDVYIGLRKPPDHLAELEKETEIRKKLEGIHLEPDFECKTEQITISEGKNKRTLILACQHFALERHDLTQKQIIDYSGRQFHVLTFISGVCQVKAGMGNEIFYPGQTCLIPAGINQVELVSEKHSSVLDAYVPDLEQDVIRPLQDNGIATEKIIRLGGITKLNSLADILKKH